MSITRRYYRTLPRWGKCLSRRFVAALGKPAGLWLPNDVVNKAYDFSSNRNIGTLNGGVTTVPGGFGTLGAAWTNPGGSSGSAPIISIKDSSGVAGAYPAFTFSVAVRATANQGDQTPILTHGLSASRDVHLALRDITNSSAAFIYLNNTSLASFPINNAWAVGQTFVLTFVFNSALTTTQRVAQYKNGVFNNFATITSTSVTLNNNGWGLWSRDWNDSNGTVSGSSISNFAWWPYALTAAQVSLLYNCLLTGEPFPLFAPQTIRRGFGIKSIVGGSSFKFRRTLSDYGTRVGSRQAI